MDAASVTSNAAAPLRPAQWIANRLPWVLLAALWFLLFKQLWLEWSTDDNYSYGYVVPALALYLFARRWADRPAPQTSAVQKSEGILVALLAVPALLLLPIRIVQESSPEWHYVSWCMTGCVVFLTLGLIDYRAGWPWVKHFAFPVAFIFTAVHWPTAIESFAIRHLTQIDTSTAVFFLNWLDVPAVQNGNVISAGGNLVGISEACSGIRSLQITVMISLFFGEYYRFDKVRRTILFLLVGIVALACNLGRTLLLVWLSVKQGNAVMEKWHDNLGLAVLGFAFSAFWGIATWMDGRRPRVSDAAPHTSATATLRPWPASFIIALFSWLIFVEGGTELWYRIRESSSPAPPAWSVHWPEDAPGFENQPVPDRSRAALKYTTGRHAAWRDADGGSWSAFFFQWAPGRTSAILARLHRPEICLPSVGCNMVREDQPRIVNIHGISILFHSYLFQENGRPLHVWWALWDGAEKQTAVVNSKGVNDPAYILRAAFSGQRNLGQQVLEIALAGPDDDDAANEAFDHLIPKLIQR